jgi:hypothetical protein
VIYLRLEINILIDRGLFCVSQIVGLSDIIIMSKVQYNRAPCPGRIFEDLGNGFAIGVAGGSVFYFFKGKYTIKSKLAYSNYFYGL